MNIRRTLDDFKDPLARHASFNNTCKYFAVALDNGFAIFESESCELHIEQDIGRTVNMAFVLESSQIIGLIGSRGSGRGSEQNWSQRLSLWDSAKKSEVAAIKVGSEIVGVQLSKTHIAIVFDKGINLYRHQPRIEKLATFETCSNPLGLCCLGSTIAVFPGRTPGHIQYVDLQTLKVSITPAHTSALRALALAPDGELVASASARGTLIRIHSTRSGARLSELRRGVTSAIIYSLSISPSGARLAVTSDTYTLHVFDLPRAVQPAAHSDRSGRSSPAPSAPSVFNVQKWGGLARLPFAPRVFSDVYSIASATFDPGKDDDEDVAAMSSPHAAASADDAGDVVKRTWPVKGLSGWIDDQTVVVVSAGRDARYERFAVTDDGQGGAGIVRVGWSRYLRPN